MLTATMLGEAYAGLVALGPWVGAVTPYSAVVVTKLNTPRLATLEVSEQSFFSRALTIGEEPAVPGEQPEMARFNVRNLKPSTRYYYRVRAGDERDELHYGSFVTLPVEGERATFSFAFSADAETGSAHAVFAEIEYHKPLFFIVAGNLYRARIVEPNPALFREAYDAVLSSETQGNLYRQVPLVYIWGDADFPAGSTAEPVALSAYREYVPHHPLADDSDGSGVKGSIAQAFTVGRVRFILADGEARSIEGLKRALLETRGHFPLVFVTCAARSKGNGAVELRRELRDWLKENEIAGVCFLSGGGALAADSDEGIPLLVAGPLDRSGGDLASGPELVGVIRPTSGEGQFGWVEVSDQGTQIAVTFLGFNQHGREKLRYTFEVLAP